MTGTFSSKNSDQNDNKAFLALAGEAVHEINNLLVAVAGYARAGMSSSNALEISGYFKKIRECVTQAGDLSKDLLSFARPSCGEKGDVGKAVQAVVDFYKFKSNKGYAGLEWHVAFSLPNVDISTTNLQLVLGNLVKNAFEAVEGRFSPVIRVTANVHGNEVRIDVWNSHSYIPPESMELIFQPFYTTKLHTSGSGLGLSMIKRLVTQAGGKVAVKNDPAGGVLFSIFLPVSLQSES